MATPKKTTAKKTTKPKAKAAAAPKTTKPKAAAKKPAAKAKAPTTPVTGSAPVAKTAKPKVVNAPVAVVVGPAMRKKEIIEEVVRRTGMKKRDVKPIFDSLLGVMGEALDEGREMVLPPFGRVKPHRKKDTPKKKIFFAKVHQNKPPAAGGVAPAAKTEDAT